MVHVARAHEERERGEQIKCRGQLGAPLPQEPVGRTIDEQNGRGCKQRVDQPWNTRQQPQREDRRMSWRILREPLASMPNEMSCGEKLVVGRCRCRHAAVREDPPLEELGDGIHQVGIVCKEQLG